MTRKSRFQDRSASSDRDADALPDAGLNARHEERIENPN